VLLVRVEGYHKVACAGHQDAIRIAESVAQYLATEEGRQLARRRGSVTIWRRPRWKNDHTIYLSDGAVAAVETLGLASSFGEEVPIQSLPKDLELLWGWEHGSAWGQSRWRVSNLPF